MNIVKNQNINNFSFLYYFLWCQSRNFSSHSIQKCWFLYGMEICMEETCIIIISIETSCL